MSTGVQIAIGRFVWHENISSDTSAATKFYGDLLGWQTEVWKPGETDYAMIKVGDQTHGGYGPAQGGAPPHWLGHVLFEDVDETARIAEAAGGKILHGPMDIPEIGRFAIIADPQGAVLSAYSPAGEAPTPEGVFLWDELHTSDPDGAKSFYTEVFGWKARDMDMADIGTYTMFQRAGDVDTAGAMRLSPGIEAPPHWLPYIGVDDIDATAAKAKELGATVFMEPTDIPNVGRIAVIKDPIGAVFGLFKSAG